ncbi:SWI/SNF-related matrix-associated actin-dependent regulator of chromatin subfamily D member 1-like isoform X1 [Dysidea avara]|uniref:SWI/SNF-related matrix-associated actin-dependent regulator of chromatin subfamily D member 1-like isoform X1 n=1 Tax=Dysidea avara TaxID=196820 RepID=UPI003321CE70
MDSRRHMSLPYQRHMSGLPSSSAKPSSISRSPYSTYQQRRPTPQESSSMAQKKAAAEAAAAKAKSKMKRSTLGEKILSQRVRDMVPESQAYMDLLSFEKRLDSTIMRKKLEIQEAMKRPLKQRRKLRIFISHQFLDADSESEETTRLIPHWELRIEGRLLNEVFLQSYKYAVSLLYLCVQAGERPDTKAKLKFTSFFKSVIIELDKDMYGPDNHLIEWQRTRSTVENDGFQIVRPGEDSVKSTILLSLFYQPSQYKLSSRLARLLGVHTATRPTILQAMWQYIKTNQLQDANEREYINCDKYFEQLFEVPRMKFTEIPRRLQPLLLPPDPIVIQHNINKDAPDRSRTACYDVEVDIDDPVKPQMLSFMMSSSNQQDIASLDTKIHETVEQINSIRIQREFFLGFSDNPQKFINDWMASQNRDLKVMTNKMGNPEAEKRAEYYDQHWTKEAVTRYFYTKVQQRRSELEQALGIKHT